MPQTESLHEKAGRILDSMGKVVMGQEDILEQVLCCFFAGGHVLLEGVPGLGKTLLARTLAKLVDADYHRIQFTPDLLPSDIIGTAIFNPSKGKFLLHKGPVFTEVLLADEINRTPPKSQAALLEAMEERQVTIEGRTNVLSDLFFVIATQNPIEYEGTYPLPETQLDRFMMKIVIGYPAPEKELAVLRNYAEGVDLRDLDALIPGPIISRDEVIGYRTNVFSVTAKDSILEYARTIVADTRDGHFVQLGASTRAAVALLKASQSLAALRGSEFVTPEDVKDAARPVLRHRIILRPEALIDGLTADDFLNTVLERVPVPR